MYGTQALKRSCPLISPSSLLHIDSLDFDDDDDDDDDWNDVLLVKDLVIIVSEGRTKAPTNDPCDKQTSSPRHKAATKHLDCCITSGLRLFLEVVMGGLIVWLFGFLGV